MSGARDDIPEADRPLVVEVLHGALSSAGSPLVVLQLEGEPLWGELGHWVAWWRQGSRARPEQDLPPGVVLAVEGGPPPATAGALELVLSEALKNTGSGVGVSLACASFARRLPLRAVADTAVRVALGAGLERLQLVAEDEAQAESLFLGAEAAILETWTHRRARLEALGEGVGARRRPVLQDEDGTWTTLELRELDLAKGGPGPVVEVLDQAAVGGKVRFPVLALLMSRDWYWSSVRNRPDEAFAELARPLANLGDLELVLNGTAGDLLGIPWEHLVSPGPESRSTRGLVRRLRLDRSLPGEGAEGARATGHGLVLAVDGGDEGRWPKARELAEWGMARGLGVRRVHTVQQLKDALPARYLHLRAHGGAEGFLLGGELWSPAQLAREGVPELVFLASCGLGALEGDAKEVEGSNLERHVLPLLRAGVAVVVAAGTGIKGEAADRFARAFWRGLFEGRCLGRATDEGRRAALDAELARHMTYASLQVWGDPDWRLEAPRGPAPEHGTPRSRRRRLEAIAHLARAPRPDLPTLQHMVARELEGPAATSHPEADSEREVLLALEQPQLLQERRGWQAAVGLRAALRWWRHRQEAKALLALEEVCAAEGAPPGIAGLARLALAALEPGGNHLVAARACLEAAASSEPGWGLWLAALDGEPAATAPLGPADRGLEGLVAETLGGLWSTWLEEGRAGESRLVALRDRALERCLDAGERGWLHGLVRLLLRHGPEGIEGEGALPQLFQLGAWSLPTRRTLWLWSTAHDGRDLDLALELNNLVDGRLAGTGADRQDLARVLEHELPGADDVVFVVGGPGERLEPPSLAWARGADRVQRLLLPGDEGPRGPTGARWTRGLAPGDLACQVLALSWFGDRRPRVALWMHPRQRRALDWRALVRRLEARGLAGQLVEEPTGEAAEERREAAAFALSGAELVVVVVDADFVEETAAQHALLRSRNALARSLVVWLPGPRDRARSLAPSLLGGERRDLREPALQPGDPPCLSPEALDAVAQWCWIRALEGTVDRVDGVASALCAQAGVTRMSFDEVLDGAVERVVEPSRPALARIQGLLRTPPARGLLYHESLPFHPEAARVRQLTEHCDWLAVPLLPRRSSLAARRRPAPELVRLQGPSPDLSPYLDTEVPTIFLGASTNTTPRTDPQLSWMPPAQARLSREAAQDDRPLEVAAAVTWLCRFVFVHGWNLVFGGHPAITPIVLDAAQALAGGPSGRILVFQSTWFPEHLLPPSSAALGARPQATLIRHEPQWPDGIDLPYRSLGGGHDEERSWAARTEALTQLRQAMVSAPGLVGGVFMGGLEGVEEELRLTRTRLGAGATLLLPGTGGATAVLASRHKGLKSPRREGSSPELLFPFFESLVTPREVPGAPSDGPPALASGPGPGSEPG